MTQTVNVTGYGPVDFPDEMSDADISRAIETELPKAAPQGFLGKAADVAKSFVQGAGADAVFGALGAPGDAASFATRGIDKGVQKIAGWLGAEPQPDAPVTTTLPTSAALHSAFNAATGEPDYVPQTTAGRYAQTVGAFLPQAVATGGAGVGNIVRQAVAPAIASQAAGDAAKGTALEGPARMGAALLTGGAGGLGTLPNQADYALARVAGNLSPADLQAARTFIANAAKSGIKITIPEAIDHLNNGASNAGAAMRLAEMVPEGQAVTAPFFAQRAGQVQGATAKVLDQIAPATNSPAAVGLNAQTAAAGGIKAAGDALNADTKPLYDAAGPTLLPTNTYLAIASPAFQASLERLRNDPVLGPQYAHLPNNSIGIIDAVTKDMMAQGQAATNSAAAGFNPQKGAVLTNDAATARLVAARTDPAYAHALALQQDVRQNVIDPLKNTSAGAIANTPAIPAQTAALFPTNPVAGLPAETAATIQMLERQIPGSAAAIVRQHVENQANTSMRDNAGGPNANGGAKFAAAVAGNPLQEANLTAGLSALPNGATAAPAVSNLLDILRATGRRQGLGSLTAPNAMALTDLGKTSVAGNIGQSILDASPTKFSTGVADAIARARIGSRAGDLAQVLLGMDPASNFARIQAAKDSVPTIGSIFAKSAGLASASQN